MSTVLDLRRAVRVVAAEDRSGAHEFVNVTASKAGDFANALKEHTQVTASQYNAQPAHVKNQIDTLVATASTDKLKRTIYINGYSGPS